MQQRVVDADVVGAALHARLLEVEHARLPARVDEASVVPGAGSGQTEREGVTGDGHLATGTETAGLAEEASITVETHEAYVAGAVLGRVVAPAA